MPRLAAREAVLARAERVLGVVGRVWDWETARVRCWGIFGSGGGGGGGGSVQVQGSRRAVRSEGEALAVSGEVGIIPRYSRLLPEVAPSGARLGGNLDAASGVYLGGN